jgi:hypothetical protein
MRLKSSLTARIRNSWFGSITVVRAFVEALTVVEPRGVRVGAILEDKRHEVL